ncbi:MAG: metalloregulator ArsR/SmtB family transcription factor [Candidatus Bathyarchaeia archaeon]
MSKFDERLVRLLSSKTYPPEDASKYAAELKHIAKEVAPIEACDKHSRFFKALADKTRLRILKLLEFRKMCVCEIMVALGLTQPTASHHLRVLENAKLVKYEKEGKWVFYSIADPKMIENMSKLNIL